MKGIEEMKTILQALGKTDKDQHLIESVIVMGLTALVVAAAFSVLALAVLGER